MTQPPPLRKAAQPSHQLSAARCKQTWSSLSFLSRAGLTEPCPTPSRWPGLLSMRRPVVPASAGRQCPIAASTYGRAPAVRRLVRQPWRCRTRPIPSAGTRQLLCALLLAHLAARNPRLVVTQHATQQHFRPRQRRLDVGMTIGPSARKERHLSQSCTGTLPTRD